MRRSTLHCALLFAVALFTRSIVHRGAVHAQTVASTQGSLRVIDAEHKLAQEFLLKHTTVNAKVNGCISRVEVTHDFENPAAKILLGQNVRIVISYVETLKYEDGSYEWSFPMTVTPRYHPAGSKPGEADDSARISPPNTATGMRAGHDVWIQLDLNASVPVLGVTSEIYETAVELVNDRRAKVQLKDRDTIPNKDFVFKYSVAGNSINDAVLTHRSERGGFFTLILQPPQRVPPRDVRPRELVLSGQDIGRDEITALMTLYPSFVATDVISFTVDQDPQSPRLTRPLLRKLRKKGLYAVPFLSSYPNHEVHGETRVLSTQCSL